MSQFQYERNRSQSSLETENVFVPHQDIQNQSQPPPVWQFQSPTTDSNERGGGIAVVRFQPSESQSEALQPNDGQAKRTFSEDRVIYDQPDGRKVNGSNSRQQSVSYSRNKAKASEGSTSTHRDGMRRGRRRRERLKEGKGLPSMDIPTDTYDDSFEETGYTYGTGPVPSMQYQTVAGSRKPFSGTWRSGDNTSRSRIRRQRKQLDYSPHLGRHHRSYTSLSLPQSPSPHQAEKPDPVRRAGFHFQPKAIGWHPAHHDFSTSSWSSRRESYTSPQHRPKQITITEPGLRRPISYERLRQGSRSGQQTQDSRQATDNRRQNGAQDQTHPLRHDTTDWDESQGSGKPIRYNIPIRLHNVRVSDTEKGYNQDDYGRDRSRRNRKSSHARVTHYTQEQTEIIQTRWIADDDLNEVLTLTVNDDEDNSDRQGGSQKMRWVHFTTDSPDLNSFTAQVLRLSGLDSHDEALVLRLLKKIEKQNERPFFHGRYLDPLTLTYNAVDDDGISQLPPLSATFICLPFLTAHTSCAHNTTSEDALHPVRALLQARYRLQSTVQQDKAQVITQSSTCSKLGLLHVPQIWALVINRRTIITCTALSAATLRADTIITLLHSKAKADRAAWSIRFTSLWGDVFFIPFERCKTWFELIRHIGDNCLEPSATYSEYWIEQLADHDSYYEIINETGGQIINEENWPMIIASKDVKAISLVLQEKRIYLRDRQKLLGNAISDGIADLSGSDSDTSSFDSPPEDESGPTGNQTEEATILAAVGSDERKPVLFRAKGYSRGRSSRRSSRSSCRRFGPRSESKRYDAPDDLGKMALVKRVNTERQSTSPHKFETRSLLYKNSDVQDYPARPFSDMSYYDGLGKEGQLNAVYRLSKQRKMLLRMAGRSRIKDPSILYYIPPARRAHRTASRTRHHLSWHTSTVDRSKDRSRSIGTGSTDEIIPQRVSLNLDLEKTASPQELQTTSRFSNDDTGATIKITPSLDINTTSRPTNQREQRSELKDPVQPHSFPPKNLTSLADSSRLSSDSILGAEKGNPMYKPFFLWPVWTKSTHRPPQLESRKSQHKFEAEANAGSCFEAGQNDAQQQTFRSAERPSGGGLSIEDTAILYDILDEIYYRLGKPKVSDQFNVYRSLILGDEGDVAMTMLNLRNKQTNQNGKDTGEDDCCTKKETVFVLASKIFSAFAPNACHAEILKKYWGGVQSILTFEGYESTALSLYIGDIATDFWELWDLIRNIHRGVGNLDETHRTQYHLPKAIIPAFQQLIVYLAATSAFQNATDARQRTKASRMVEDSFFECKDSLLMARNQLLLMVHTADYRESAGFEAIEPEALLAVIMNNLLNISHAKGSLDLTEIYTEHAARLNFKIQNHSSVRVYEDIKMMSEELDAIRSIFNQQISTLWDYKIVIGRSNGSLDLCHGVLDRMIAQLDRRLDEFRELQLQADTARELAAQSISLKAESNGRAILTFTVVTIIFLPLSFVASFLGMNTVDIRGMDSTQNLFWAIGLPLTCSILSLALLVAYREQLFPSRIFAFWKGSHLHKL